MDILSVVGILLALVAIVGGNLLEGGHTDSLVQLTAFIIVIGGTLGAVLLQTPIAAFLHSLKLVGWIFVPPKQEAEVAIEKIVDWSNVARKEGLLGLESVSEGEPDLFVRTGLQRLVDGREPDAIRSILELELYAKEHHHPHASKAYQARGC